MERADWSMCTKTKGKGHPDKDFFNLWRREVGSLAPTTFATRTKASEDIVLRMRTQKKMRGKYGVNTLSFNRDGSILMSGYDDGIVRVSNWEFGQQSLTFSIGYYDVLDAKFLLYTDDIIACDEKGNVTHSQLMESGAVSTTTLFERKHVTAKRLAVVPGSPHTFYSCDTDGEVLHFDLRTKRARNIFKCITPYTYGTSSITSLPSIVVDPRNPNLIAIGGFNRYVEIYDIRKYNLDGSSDSDCFVELLDSPHSKNYNRVVIGMAFSKSSELLISYGLEPVYLFPREQEIVSNYVPAPVSKFDGDADDDFHAFQPPCASLRSPDNMPKFVVYRGYDSRSTAGVNFFGPNSEYVTCGTYDGRIIIWRKKDGKVLCTLDGNKITAVNCIAPHPLITTIASGGFKSGIKIWTPDASNMDKVSNDDSYSDDGNDFNVGMNFESGYDSIENDTSDNEDSHSYWDDYDDTTDDTD